MCNISKDDSMMCESGKCEICKIGIQNEYHKLCVACSINNAMCHVCGLNIDTIGVANYISNLKKLKYNQIKDFINSIENSKQFNYDINHNILDD